MNRKEYWKKHYDALYQRCLYCSPGLKPIIEYIKERANISDNERKRLYQEYENGSTSAKKRLIEYYMRTALQIAYLISRKTGVALDELFSIALEEMILVIERFNRPKGEKYLYLYIRNSIQRSLNVYAAKLPKHVSLDSVHNWEYDGERRLIEQLHDKFLIQYISECTEINDRERTIIMMYFGLSENGKYTIPEIADKYRITENNVKALYRRGVRKLAKSELLKKLHEDKKPMKAELKVKKTTEETAMKLQFCGMEYDIEEIRKAVVDDCKAKNYNPITALEIYIKPEDNAAYYVVNHENADKVDL